MCNCNIGGEVLNDIDLFRLIGAISRKATTDVNQAVKQYGLDNNLFIYLTRIVENEGITQYDLVNLVKVDKTTLSRALMKLERLDYLFKITSTTNRNYKELYPTQKAKEIYNNLFELENRYANTAIANLTPLERVELRKSLMKISVSLG